MVQAVVARSTRAPVSHVWSAESHVLNEIDWLRSTLVEIAGSRLEEPRDALLRSVNRCLDAFVWIIQMLPSEHPRDDQCRVMESYLVVNFLSSEPRFQSISRRVIVGELMRAASLLATDLRAPAMT